MAVCGCVVLLVGTNRAKRQEVCFSRLSAQQHEGVNKQTIDDACGELCFCTAKPGTLQKMMLSRLDPVGGIVKHPTHNPVTFLHAAPPNSALMLFTSCLPCSSQAFKIELKRRRAKCKTEFSFDSVNRPALV